MIRGQWEARVGIIASPGAFEVLSQPKPTDVDETLMRPLRRQPRIILSLAYQDEERRKLDRGEDFAIQYTAQAFLEEAKLKIDSASLVDEQGVEHAHRADRDDAP